MNWWLLGAVAQLAHVKVKLLWMGLLPVLCPLIVDRPVLTLVQTLVQTPVPMLSLESSRQNICL